MAYVKNTWVDRAGTTRYHETVDEDGALIFTPDYEKVTEMGTPVNADNMNHIEDGIVDHENRITVLEGADNASNFLNKSQITNCLPEVPQRINLTLSDGTLTLKKGSVVTVPYGTTNRTSEFPVGSQFLNSNWKVVETQFANNKFFVWAELQKDISLQRTETPDGNDRFITIYMDGGINGAVSAVSGTTFSNQIGYNTSTNEVHWYNADGTYLATYMPFPIGIVACNDTYVFGSIKQVFNGMGYIGSTFWVDKGVKALVPNGRNADGTLNNLEWTNPRLYVYNHTGTEARVIQVYYLDGNGGGWFRGSGVFYQDEEPTASSGMQRWYQPSSNLWYERTGSNPWAIRKPAILSTFELNSGVISNFNPKQPFRAVDYNEYRLAIDNKVSKTGDTMTGRLVVNTTDSTPIVIKGMSGVDVTVNPSSTKYYGIQLEDVNGVRMGRLEGIFNANGTIETSITANKTVNGSIKYANFRVGVDANGKATYSHPQIISSYQNGTSGYNIWSNGYCEQWGRTGTGQGLKTVTLLKTFDNTNYSALTTGTYDGDSTDNGWDYVRNITTTSFDIYQQNGGCMWKACGYLASGQY